VINWLRNSILLFLSLLAILLIIGYTYVKDPALWPINSVHIVTELKNVQPEMIKRIVVPHAKTSFFTIKMGALQQSLQALPWVKKVNIERVWPDTLKIAIIEQTAVVRWQDTAFLNKDGELFDPKQPHDIVLPQLRGDNARYQEVFEAFGRLTAQLSKVGLSIVELDLSPRSTWSALLDNGTWLYLGQDDIDVRLARFLKVMPALHFETLDVQYVDLRYTNGWVLGSNKS
jgi:cell division protein FtsQ